MGRRLGQAGEPLLTRVSRIIAWGLVSVAVILTIGPRWVRPYTSIPHDTEHILAFVVVGLAFGIAYPGRLLIMIVIAVLLVASLEAGQLWVPGRHGYFRDFVINGLAMCAGLCAGAFVQRVMKGCTKTLTN